MSGSVELRLRRRRIGEVTNQADADAIPAILTGVDSGQNKRLRLISNAVSGDTEVVSNAGQTFSSHLELSNLLNRDMSGRGSVMDDDTPNRADRPPGISS